MKILVISDIPPFVVGGAEMQALRLIEAWISEGHDVQCIGRNLIHSEIICPSGKFITHQISTIKKMGKYLRAISYFFSLSTFLLQNRKWPDVVYTRFLGDAAATVCLLKYLHLIKIILISTPANAGSRGDLFYITSAPFGRFWTKLINSQCNAINLIAPEMLHDLNKANVINPLITQIPNGVPIYNKTALLKNSNITSMISVGRLSKQKGYDTFLEALSKLNNYFSLFSVTIIGDGPERENLLNLVNHYSLQDKVHFLGELNQIEIRAHIHDADIFVLPSRYEGMSNAGLEAMESGKAVILTKCGGLDTYIQPNMGWIAIADSVESLLVQLLSAMRTNKSELNEMGIRNREFVINNFSIKDIAHRYIDLFNLLINSKK